MRTGKHNPTAKTYLEKMNRFENTLDMFLASEQFKQVLIDHACHDCNWHYEHQNIRLRLLPGKQWEINPVSGWSNGKDCIITLNQISTHYRELEKMDIHESFYDILERRQGKARIIAEILYESQEEYIKANIRTRFHRMRSDGRMD